MADTRTLYFVYYLIAGVFVILMLGKMGIDWGTGKAAQRDYLVLDLALLTDSAYAVPGEVEVNYIIPGYRSDIASKAIDFLKGVKRGYNLSIKNFEIRTTPRIGKESYAEFVRDENIGLENQSIDVLVDFDMPFNLKKDSSDIFINKFASELDMLRVPQVNTKDHNWEEKKIIFDGDGKTESILESVRVNLGAKANFQFIGYEEFDKDKKTNQQKKAEHYFDSNMLIAIYYGDESLNNTVVFGNSNPRSEKLGKMILKGMILEKDEVEEFNEVMYSPKVSSGFPSEDLIDIIDIGSAAVFIELNVKEMDVVKRKRLANLITQQIKGYYER